MQQRNTKLTWVKYLAAVIIGLIIALVICVVKGLFQTDDMQKILRIICDACSLSGILLCGIGLLSFVAKEGTFDVLAYGFKAMRRGRRGYADDARTPKTYYDYKESMKTKRKTAWHFVIVGLGYIAIAIVLIIVLH